jgi:hypothetical protein
MTWYSDVCFVNVNGIIVDDGSERLLAIRIEEKGSTVNLNGTGLREYIKEIPLHLLCNLLRWLRILSLPPQWLCNSRRWQQAQGRYADVSSFEIHKGLMIAFDPG